MKQLTYPNKALIKKLHDKYLGEGLASLSTDETLDLINHTTELTRDQALELAAAHARIAELEAALQPFAEAAQTIPDRLSGNNGTWTGQITDSGVTQITINDLRQARAALENKL